MVLVLNFDKTFMRANTFFVFFGVPTSLYRVQHVLQYIKVSSFSD